MRRRMLVGVTLVVATAAALVVTALGLDRFSVDVLTTLLIYVAAPQAWNLLAGFAGQFSLATAAFFGTGAYGVAMTMIHLGASPVVAVLAGGAAAAALSGVLAVPLLRLRGDYFAIGSLTAALALQALVVSLSWTGGSSGLDLPLQDLPAGTDLLGYAVGVAAAAAVVCVVVRFSAFGLRLAAIRENPDAATGVGVPVQRHRLGAMLISGGLTGLAGGVFALQQVHLEPSGTLALSWAISVVLMTVIGGLGSLVGPVLGAVLINLMLTRQLDSQPVLGLAIEGLVLVAVVLVAPRGVWPTAVSLARRLLPDRRTGAERVNDAPATSSGAVGVPPAGAA